ncbi:unnamed protein product [Trichobilharzia szidati]|nr:unnamed protein product [Trichobilharzia szidati]
MFKKVPRTLARSILVLTTGVITYKYHSLIGTIVYCEGISMQPTVNDGDYLIVERLSIISGRIKRGDVVIAGQPRKYNTSHVLKRIKGLEDDQITFWDTSRWEFIAKQVPVGHVWLEGDNTSRSLDSRSYGPVPISHLEYKVLLRVWPLKQFGRLKTPTPISCTTGQPDDAEIVQLSLRRNGSD